MKRDVAPVFTAQALLAHRVGNEAVVAYLRDTWQLDTVDARAAIAAAYTLERQSLRSRSETLTSDAQTEQRPSNGPGPNRSV
ncbi:MAG: hypothetical protein ACLPVY_04995 [Acidimicrobiia bacterium]